MIDRRRMLQTALAYGSALSAPALFSSSTHAADVEPRGTLGKLERLPTMNLESYHEFMVSTREWATGDLIGAASRRAIQVMRENGIGPNEEFSFEAAEELLGSDPIIMFRAHTSLRMQRHIWQELQREFHSNYDAYMSEMEAADKSGPGVLELNPGIEPEYAKHEIHMQPGGYVGDPFAGHMYHYGSNFFYGGHNDQDEVHVELADTVPIPADGKVRRILDAGCSCGQQTVALKERFPDAEVWGVDVGAPMVRYSHMRAVDMGVDVNFRHAMAEDTGFPDDYFDIVTSYLLHHEVPEQATYKIIQESARLVRPGGVYFPVDSRTSPAMRRREKTALAQINSWVHHRWNHERWTLEYAKADFFCEMERAGFIVNPEGPEATLYPFPGRGMTNVVGIKPA